MRFMGLREADRNTGATVRPSEKMSAAMGKFNEKRFRARRAT